MDIEYTMTMILESGEPERVYLPQEQLKYIFEHMEIGTHVWTTNSYYQTGKLIYKDFRGEQAHLLISVPDQDSKKSYF
ncbi:hypothetical protein C206_03842 [Pseudomonas putida TRO1]|uniref:Uncharacterized protein n=1 Tax=Pseudomonas putida TRO1 TaxID=1227924 RepID=A0AAD2WDF6_PSEPU|nr:MULTISPECIES: hypothetical protein [Pseudomonas]ELS0921867.1 hypothetical protein [Pseudomonas putida]ENY79078.1 hypothetical protein C206_03842 [Pseudomonas putida TRO1]PKF27923.1 hypothetical protein CW309_03335 [Pseudomonas hunanensis]UWH22886.1 hypothetical protein KW568_00145 [Pseudomonas sp. HD6515]HDS0938123.1 hypothetical protein [Pseudomonas putida]